MQIVVHRWRSHDRWIINPAGTLRYSRLKLLGSIERVPGKVRPLVVRIRDRRKLGITGVERSFDTYREAEAFAHSYFENEVE